MITIATEDLTLHAGGHEFGIRVYPAPRPDGTVLVWLHGGAFIFGDLDVPEADATSRHLAEHGTSVVSVDYTLAPIDALDSIPLPPPQEGMPSPEELVKALDSGRSRAAFPVASVQSVAAFDWAAEHATDLGGLAHAVAIGGASAGGNLAASATARLRDRGANVPSASCLIYPVLHADLPAPDDALAARLAALPTGFDFTPEATAAINANYLGGASPREAYAFPGGHDPRGLAPTLIVNADTDRLRMSGQAYAAELAAAGVDVEVALVHGSEHGFLNGLEDPHRVAVLARMSRFIHERAAAARP
ncbi:alpha/beta hydrolase fold domain-containing protein [Demequina iriomotensis]|uniref:alpha/beta hydrolase fold domain-containing protein n=1 Tax=Demequina iriomotensis TaxID=1536641 RepID=UPI00078365B9|nr:alpha/beta hydrolase fold domain-containing protein [Demequina iriomotensis]